MDFTHLREFMDRLTDWVIPGNSISIYHKNNEVFRYSSGYSNVEKQEPMSGDMFVNIYSCSKIATVVAALQLLERGHIVLYDPLYEYIPQFKEMWVKDPSGNIEKAKKHITIGNLFTMTAGFTYNMNSDGIKKARKLTNGEMNTVKVAECIAEDPLIFEPGTHWEYSLCHDVLAALVEVVSGKRFADYVKENIFEPCGIRNAVYHQTPEIQSKMATQYQLSMDGDMDIVSAQKGSKKVGTGEIKAIGPEASHVLGPMYDSGGAGITTTVNEYALLGNALANFGKAKTGEQILAKGTVELLRTNQLSEKLLQDFNWPQLSGYGYGLGVRTMIDKGRGGSVGPLGDFGWGGAAGANILIDPDNEFSYFYAHHVLNPMEIYYQPRLRNVAYMCLNR